MHYSELFNFRYNFIQPGFVPTKKIHTQDDGKFYFWNENFTKVSGPYDTWEQATQLNKFYEKQLTAEKND